MSDSYTPADYLHLYDFRLRVRGMYEERNVALRRGADPVETWNRWRSQRDDLFATHSQTAIPEEHRGAFTGPAYFPYDPHSVIDASIVTEVQPLEFTVDTGDGRQTSLRRVARVQFALDGEACSLDLYWIDVYGGGLFLPFRDATAGVETYGGGRYLFDTVKGSDSLFLPGGGVTLDFNYAYNPSCAYNYRWVCPLARAENRLTVAVQAGEKRYMRPEETHESD